MELKEKYMYMFAKEEKKEAIYFNIQKKELYELKTEVTQPSYGFLALFFSTHNDVR